jgi:hypothetical protein
MEAMRQAWTDDRLDDLSAGMHDEFGRVHDEFGRVRAEMRDEFSAVRTEVRDLRGDLNSRFEAVDARFDALNRTMILGFGSIVSSVIGSVAAVLVAQAL